MVFSTRLTAMGVFVAALTTVHGCVSNGNTIIEPRRSEIEHADVATATAAEYAREKQEMISQRD